MHRHRFIVLGLATLFFVFEPISSTNNTTNSTPTTTATIPTPTTTTILSTKSPTTNATNSSSTTTAPNTTSSTSNATTSSTSPPSIATTSSSSPTTAPNTTSPKSNETTTTSSPSPTSNTTTSSPATTSNITTTSSTVTTTSPPRNKSITVEATFNIKFKEEYLDKTSDAYEDLKENFTHVLNTTFFGLKGYLGVEILSFHKGSVICKFNVIFDVTANQKAGDVKKTLQTASDDRKLGGYVVTKIKIDDGSSTSAPQTTSGPKPTTPSSNEFWDKVIMDYLGGTLISFIIMVVAVGLCLILLIALICTCHHYRKLKKKTQFPKDVIINNDSAWINSNDNLLMWERNLRATEVNPGNPPNRPTNEKRP